MARKPLSQLDDWELVNEDQDLRGRMLLDHQGGPIGTITEMIVDTDTGYVDSIVLYSGAVYSARDFQLRSGKVVLLGGTDTGSATAGGARIAESLMSDIPASETPISGSGADFFREKIRTVTGPSGGAAGATAPVHEEPDVPQREVLTGAGEVRKDVIIDLPARQVSNLVRMSQATFDDTALGYRQIAGGGYTASVDNVDEVDEMEKTTEIPMLALRQPQARAEKAFMLDGNGKPAVGRLSTAPAAVQLPAPALAPGTIPIPTLAPFNGATADGTAPGPEPPTPPLPEEAVAERAPEAGDTLHDAGKPRRRMPAIGAGTLMAVGTVGAAWLYNRWRRGRG